MRVLPLHLHCPLRERSGSRAVAAVVAAVAVLLALTVSPPSSAAGDARPGASLPTAEPEQPPSDTSAPTPGTYRVTLLTGDVVVLHVAADGRQAASLEDAPADGSGRDPQIFERDGHVHVVPAEVSDYLAADVVDERLFDVTSLVMQGLHDAAANGLPLVVSVPEGVSTFSAPSGAEVGRRLGSIGAVSMTAEKDAVRSVWESLRGTAPRADDAATLAGAGAVWLDGVVHAALDESVAQVGAPAAWAAGLDGSGVSVAVLDSGYDPSHPDLQDRVVASANFSAEESAVDGNGHGTHVAATVAGSGAASDGTYRGVAPGAKLLIGKVLDDTGAGLESEIIAGMQWAVGQGADVVNMSLGTTFPSDGSDPMSLAVNQLTESSDALFVVAAGNTGPVPSSVGSPGAADAALTVGAVDKADEAAWFSSRGPRFGDGAIKPEIVAPGVGIAAARAAGTSLGNLLDEHYTALNGTSMATPHVAGAAAILAQQHPDWGAEELKARLVSTAAHLDDEPVTFQGAGRLDVAAAVDDTVGVDHGALHLGLVRYDEPAVTRTLTYHNPTEQRVVLRLSSEVTGPGLAEQGHPRVLRFSRPVLSIPPGGQASTEVRLSPRGLVGGTYEGEIVARSTRDREIHARAVTSFAIEGPRHTVAVEALDRNGDPATGTIELWDIDDWESQRIFLIDGHATIEAFQGTYMLVTTITTGEIFFPADTTVAVDPELVVDGDVTVTYDAREGEPVTVETPRESDLTDLHVMLRRSVGDESVTVVPSTSLRDKPLYLLPDGEVSTGEFELTTAWQLIEPQLIVDVPVNGGFRIDPAPVLLSGGNKYVGQASLLAVDAGTGTPEEFASVDAEGAVAVVSRTADTDAQVAAASAAGAVAVLIHADTPDGMPPAIGAAPIPVYQIDPASGHRLRLALADDALLELQLRGIADSTYTYRLGFDESGQLPAGQEYVADVDELAAVSGVYRDSSERMIRNERWFAYPDSADLAISLSLLRSGPLVRTDYLSTDGVQWRRSGTPYVSPTAYIGESAIETYLPGHTYHQEWWGPLVRPSVPPRTGLEEYGMPVARFRDAIRMLIPPHRFGDDTMYTTGRTPGETYELSLYRDGELVGSANRSDQPSQFTVPAGEAEFELKLKVETGESNRGDPYWSDTSVATDTSWRFTSQRPEGDRAVLPLVQANYELEVGMYNEMPVGESYPLVVRPEYQPGASGPGAFDVAVQVSFDDGANWTEAEVEVGDEAGFVATVPAAGEAGFATVRVVVSDDAGNSMTQRIDRAWRIG